MTRKQEIPRVRWNGPRDLRILHALGRMGLLTAIQAKQISPFGSREAAARRLRKLARLGLVRIFKPRDRTQSHRYGLREAGKERVLAELEGVTARDLHLSRGIDRQDLEHMTELVDLRIQLTLTIELRPELDMTVYLGEPDLRRLIPKGQTRWVPDAFFVLESRLSQRELGFWLELDRGTTPPSRWVKGKLKDLAEHAAQSRSVFDTDQWVVLVVTSNERRARTLDRHLRQLSSDLFQCANLADALAQPLGAIWHRSPPPDSPTQPFQPSQKLSSIPELLFQRSVPAAGTPAFEKCKANA